MSWLILADDLTGAADAADAFARRGMPTTVSWGDGRPRGAGVFAYDAGSRGLDAVEAGRLRREHLQALGSAGAQLFVKIDSTLRGQPAAEIRATLDSGDGLGILAPAFPAMGRTTEGGRIWVRGAPLEATDTWRLEHSYPTADLAQVLGGARVDARLIPLAVVRAGRLTAALEAVCLKGGVAICDAATDEDLDRIAAAGAALARPPVWIGSGGLSAALARASEPAAAEALACGPRPQGVLTVVGSLAGASRAAAARLAASGQVTHVQVTTTSLDACAEVSQALQAGRDVLVDLVADRQPDLTKGARLAEALAGSLGPAAAHVGALAVTGGETARALLSAFGVDGVRLAGGPEAGVTLGLTQGGLSIPLVTKAGAFGDDGVLLRAVERLRRIKLEGKVA
jgi:uncharacterized protein YgbK (DUF1537 family)